MTVLLHIYVGTLYTYCSTLHVHYVYAAFDGMV